MNERVNEWMEREPSPALVSVVALNHSNQTSSQLHGTGADEGQGQEHVHGTSSERGQTGPPHGPSSALNNWEATDSEVRRTASRALPGVTCLAAHGHNAPTLKGKLPPPPRRHHTGTPQDGLRIARSALHPDPAKARSLGGSARTELESHRHLEASHGFVCIRDAGPLQIQTRVLWG